MRQSSEDILAVRAHHRRVQHLFLYANHSGELGLQLLYLKLEARVLARLQAYRSTVHAHVHDEMMERMERAGAKVVDVAKTTPLVVKEETKGSKEAAPFQQMAGKCYATSVRKAGKDVEFGVTMCTLRQDGTCPTSRSDPSCVSVVAQISMHDIQPATFVKSA